MKGCAGTYEAKVLDFIRSRDHYGATADECLVQLGLTHQNGSARVSTLAQKGLIIRSYRKRITRSGRKAFVYVAAGFAREE
jgi:predicted transcriptional regulator